MEEDEQYLSENLVKDKFEETTPNVLWCTDLSEMQCKSHRIYISALIARIDKNNNIYFYDLDNVRAVGYQDVKSFNPVESSLSTALTDKSLSRSNTDVNNNSMQNSKNDANLRKKSKQSTVSETKSDTETTPAKVSEADYNKSEEIAKENQWYILCCSGYSRHKC